MTKPVVAGAALGLESGGLACPGDGAARAIEEDRAPARTLRKRLPENREEPRGAHLRAAPVRDRGEFPPGMDPIGRSPERLAVPLESLLRRGEKEPRRAPPARAAPAGARRAASARASATSAAAKSPKTTGRRARDVDAAKGVSAPSGSRTP